MRIEVDFSFFNENDTIPLPPPPHGYLPEVVSTENAVAIYRYQRFSLDRIQLSFHLYLPEVLIAIYRYHRFSLRRIQLLFIDNSNMFMVEKRHTVKPPYSGHPLQRTPLYSGHFSRERIKSWSNSHNKTTMQRILYSGHDFEVPIEIFPYNGPPYSGQAKISVK